MELADEAWRLYAYQEDCRRRRCRYLFGKDQNVATARQVLGLQVHSPKSDARRRISRFDYQRSAVHDAFAPPQYPRGFRSLCLRWQRLFGDGISRCARFSKLIIHNNARNETVPYTYAAYAIGQVALGLHAAHTLNDVHGKPFHLVHRDVSPENILFSSDGAIKIGDFGIAKTVQMPDITPPDVVKGKFNYMSPEQAWADKIDLRSDIFSLAAVLYEATTGHCFYPAESIEACIQCARMALFELPHNVCPTFPPALEAIMLKALDLDKKCRYSSALEFKLALDSFIASQGVNITKEDWIEYIKPRIEYPPMPLPRLCASEFEPDASSLLAHSIYRGVSDDKAVEDINTTGQIGAEEIDQLRRQVISMMSSEFNVLVLQNAAQNPQSSTPNTASMPSTEDADETRTTNPRNRTVSSKNATVDASNATLKTHHEAALCPKMTYKKWIYIGVLVAVILLAVLIRSC